MEWNAKRLETICMLGAKHDYLNLWNLQKRFVKEIDQQERLQTLLLVEHLPVYTLGRGAKREHLLLAPEACQAKGIEIMEIDRGGDITFHGPGQLVGYPLLYLEESTPNPKQFLWKLEETIIRLLANFGLQGERKSAYTGVWIGEEKIAAIGVKFNRGKQSKKIITSHGFALNVNTDMTLFEQIIPCGIKDFGVTSLEQVLGTTCDMQEVATLYPSLLCEVFNLSSPACHVHQE